MNFQQEKQLAGAASPHTWLSSTDKMCTTYSLAMGSICIQSLLQFSIVIGGAGVFLFAGPVEDEFTC